MLTLARSYVITILRAPGTWVLLAVADLLAWAGITLDLFAFDGGDLRAVRQGVATMEIAAVLLAIRARGFGPGSTESDGFPQAIRHRAGSVALEFGASIGSGIGASIACSMGLAILFVFYSLMGTLGAGLAALLGIGLFAEAFLAAAWVGFVSRWGGRVAATTVGLAAFAVARLAIPAPLRGLLPAPLTLSVGDLVTSSTCALLAACGLSWLAAATSQAGPEAS